MITCRDVYGFLDDFLDGRLDVLTRLTFSSHLLLCAACRRYLASYRAAQQVARDSELGDLPKEIPAPEELVQAILASRGMRAARQPE